MMRPSPLLIVGLIALSGACGSGPEPAPDAAAEFSGPWTDVDHPPYIRRLNHFGQRADFSHDGRKILFIEKTYGDVYELELESGVIRPLTHHYYHNGYTRALYLSNGDVLLSGSRTFDPENIRPARHETAELWVLGKDLDKPPTPLGEFCSEGPAVSRRDLKIAWAVDHDNYPESLPEGVSQIFTARIDYSDGSPRLVDKKLVLDNRKTEIKANWETQNFVPPDEDKLTISAYGYRGGEALLLDLATGELTNLSNADPQYDEPEGIFPDGRHTLVESDSHVAGQGSLFIDLYKVPLDGGGGYERLTWFNEGGVFKATNPVVSDDGRFMAFQVPRSDQIAGIGRGLYLMDIEAAAKAREQRDR